MKSIPTDKLNNISAAAVQAKTGKTWADWLKVLDAAGCQKMNHQETGAVVAGLGVGPWWQQMVTVGYEQARGLRAKHQKTDGYSISSNKTMNVAIGDAFAAWHEKKQRGRWLKDIDFTIRTATANKSLRITWIDGKTSVEVLFYPKGPAKCQVSVQHNKLASAKEAAAKKLYWAEQLVKLNELLDGH